MLIFTQIKIIINTIFLTLFRHRIDNLASMVEICLFLCFIKKSLIQFLIESS